MSRRQIAQELECNFNMSGETVFHPDDMQFLIQKVVDPKYRTGFEGMGLNEGRPFNTSFNSIVTLVKRWIVSK